MIQQHLARLRRLDSCAISDAFDRSSLSGVVSGVPQQSGSGRVAGVAVTLKIDTGAPASQPPRHLGTAAIEAAGPNNVIVIEQHTGIMAGCWGGLLTLGAKVRGVAGVLADGPVRDIDEARTLEFPIFTHTLTAVTARGRLVERATNVPVSAWGITVHPGDYVMADGSAVVFLQFPGMQFNVKLLSIPFQGIPLDIGLNISFRRIFSIAQPLRTPFSGMPITIGIAISFKVLLNVKLNTLFQKMTFRESRLQADH